MTTTRMVYLDNNATTAIDPRVLGEMMPFLTNKYGNASSTSHPFGWVAAEAVEEARRTIASCINADSAENIVFMSGATESVNTAIRCLRPTRGRGHIVTSQIEHKAVLDSCRALEATGFKVTYVPPGSNGLVAPESVIAAMTAETELVSIMLANNEVGSIQNIEAIGSACRDRNILFHTDATQALGKVPFDVEAMKVDLASFSAHKVYGPKGVGGLYINQSRVRDRLDGLIVGGGQEWGIRSGTLNVPGIVGFGSAVKLACEGMAEESARVHALRLALIEDIESGIDDITINTNLPFSLPGLINISFHGIDADSLLLEMPGIALSSGSACTSAEASPSHVLTAMGRSDRSARSSVRFGIGRFNTAEEIAYVSQEVIQSVERLRSMAPA